MRLLVTLSTCLYSVFLFSQNADVKTGCAPLTVKFTPPNNATSFFWTFKDGGVSTLSNPSNIFINPGTYDVEFRETQGGPIVGTIKITVYPKPVLAISADPMSGCIPLNVKFADTSHLAGDIKVVKRLWVFGDGKSDTDPTPGNVYTTVGSFTVSLEITTNYSTCNVTQVFPDFIQTGVQPLVSFTTNPSPPVACDPPLTVSFTNTTVGGAGALSYQWTFGNTNTSGQPNPPDQTYTATGSYTVVLTATDIYGCSATVTAPVAIGHPVANFTIPDTICIGSAVTFLNASAFGTYQWTFGSGATPATSTGQNPEVTYSTPGNKNVTLTVTTGAGCSSTFSKQIFVDQANANFSVSPIYSCSDPTLFTFNALSNVASDWSWTFSDGSTSNIKNPTYTWVTPDTSGYTKYGLFLDTVVLVVTNPSGCRDTLMKVDSVWRPNAKFVPNVQDGCAPLTVTFADSSISNEKIVQWTWHFDDGSNPVVSATNTPQTHTFTQPGEYDVWLVIRNNAGCIDTSYFVRIEVGVPIAADFTVDKFEVCPGDSVQFTNLTNDPRVDAWHFSSEDDQQWHCFQEDNPIWFYTSEAGQMDVSLTTEYNGCYSTVTKSEFINVKGPIAKIHFKTTCDNTLKFDFTSESEDATKLTWYLGDGDSTNLASFSHDYKNAGMFTVILKAENTLTGCPVSYDTAVVCPTILKAVFDLPDTICGGKPQPLDASKSLGVNAICGKGYTWYFTFQRPIRVDTSVYEVFLGPSGPQTIWLEVEDVNGCKDTVQDDIVIWNRQPLVSVNDNRICIPSTLNFTGSQSTADAPIVSWEWDFGDGALSSLADPTHIYSSQPPNDTFFTINLKITDSLGCPGFATVIVNVYEPVSKITTIPNPANICAGGTVIFNAADFFGGGSSLSWQWDFGNGQTATTKASQQTYPNDGVFPVKLDFTEIATGCKGSIGTTVNVQKPPTPMFTTNVDNLAIICHPQNMVFTNTSTSPYPQGNVFWDFGNGVTTTTQAFQQPSTAFSRGTYTVKMTASTSFGCTATVERTFKVVGPIGDFFPDKPTICVGDEVTFTLKDTQSVTSWVWDFGDGTTQSGGDPVKHVFKYRPPDGFFPIKLSLKGEDDACAYSLEHPINFSTVEADFQTFAPTNCAGVDVQFINNSTQGDLAEWRFGDGSSPSNDKNPSHIYFAEGVYPVTLIVTDQPLGCKDTITIPVAITGIPNLEVFGETTVCAGDSTLIGVDIPLPGATYVWAPANQVVPPNNDPVVKVAVPKTTNFTVTVVDDNGCTDVDSVLVTVPGLFDGAQDLDTVVVKGTEVLLPVQSNPLYQFIWSPAPGPSGNPPKVIAPDTSTQYFLTVTDLLGCDSQKFTFRIRVVPEKVYYPNAFTPNGDNSNDGFFISAVGEEALVEVLSLRIYSRWGQKVYEGSGALGAVSWDGTVDGKDAPTDVYAWVAELLFATGRKVTLNGDVSLLR